MRKVQLGLRRLGTTEIRAKAKACQDLHHFILYSSCRFHITMAETLFLILFSEWRLDLFFFSFFDGIVECRETTWHLHWTWMDGHNL
uniref:Uncharacterized protein n=1 Tax=Picea glauca TaxID=3330 RepID=A0A117NGC0_PICGL|nr:hypothetical protein ABT39_MTgene1670 [Picea glauca]QHR91878.1 hypothetical protein Q903MT_gene5914 [Picea sitchensis]